MAKPRQSSFRRILLTRILLVFVPVLLIGEIVALNKARTSLLKNARQNLTESAVIKGEKIRDAIATLKTTLLIISRTKIIESPSPIETEDFLTEISQQLPTQVDCIQLTDVKTEKIVASSCGDREIAELTTSFPSAGVDIKAILPPKAGTTGSRDAQNQLQLLLSAPVYNQKGELAYSLSIKSALYQQTKNNPGSLSGSLLAFTEDGTILAHPIPERLGTKIQDYLTNEQFQNLIQNAIIEQPGAMDLSLKQGQELLAGYIAIVDPTNQESPQKLIVLAVSSVENALFGLEEIKLIIIVLTVGLIGASLLASLYLAPYLAGPVEELRDYALNIDSHHKAQPIPHNFKIREFNQLAQALDQMVERLRAWAEELEIAWKEAKTANQVKSQFLATTSHELRNPLNIIINCVRLVHDGLCDSREEEIEFLKRADETAIHLLGIINELLDISKIEAGKLSVVTEPLDLRQLLLEVINLQSVNVQQRQLQLKTDLGSEVIPVEADAAKLKQVLINVIGNATKFTEQGSITIVCEIEKSCDRSQVLIHVTDTGIGIDPAQQHKLFRPFMMVDGASRRKIEGTGLGLAISRNLIELMKGSITLKSAGLYQGTTVTIALPLIDIALLSPAQAQEQLQDIEVPVTDEAKRGINNYPKLLEESLVNGTAKTAIDEAHDISILDDNREVTSSVG
ncbi:two-component sensor histidine kinase [Calothrix sp. FACHB-1219]|uniref:sensor histidine kinase n=1 Tax=unclassified Calothrix TaxID=2619626 RepID=UPI0016860EDA|nr:MULTISPECIES: sensor histidine kinase [unclassified Calothrix]MBD2201349.1 two-component sensor histidine kinase [Calothrix sp. FACHB-168]MBD2215783.1 two-component sensor histidine kinase [Calothrix sp. FACHB-1219]